MCNDFRFFFGLRYIVIALVAVFGFSTPTFTDWAPPLGIKPAMADSHLGILDHMAPALGLDDWIDGNGKKTPPIRLADLRGKVVYLYFFQDW